MLQNSVKSRLYDDGLGREKSRDSGVIYKGEFLFARAVSLLLIFVDYT